MDHGLLIYDVTAIIIIIVVIIVITTKYYTAYLWGQILFIPSCMYIHTYMHLAVPVAARVSPKTFRSSVGGACVADRKKIELLCGKIFIA